MIAGVKCYIHDVECWPNFFLVGVLDMETGDRFVFSTEPELGHTLAEYREFFQSEKMERIWIGWNSICYDNVMIRAVLNGLDDPTELYTLSCRTIASDDWRNHVESIDGEFSVDPLAILGREKVGSLKEAGIKLGYRFLREAPFGFGDLLNHEQMIQVADDYNIHDLEITRRVAELCAEQIEMRLALSIEEQVNVLNRPNSRVGEAVLAKRLFGNGSRMKSTATHWRVNGSDLTKPFIGLFSDPECLALVERISGWDMDIHKVEVIKDGERKFEIEGSQFSEAVKIGNTAYTVGKGGLHSVDEAAVFEADDVMRILDFDFRSCYPTLIENYQIVPGHLPAAQFMKGFTALKLRRLQAKDAGHTALAAGMKIACNSIFGKYGSAYGYLADPAKMIKVTITGQLTLLVFCNLLHDLGAEVISANTDGATFRIRRERSETVIAALDEAAELLRLGLDWLEYGRVARRDINNYVACPIARRSEAGEWQPYTKVKARGTPFDANPNDLTQKGAKRVCAAAVQRFFAEEKPLAETIRECDRLQDFIGYFRCSKGYSIRTEDGTDVGGVARWYWGTGGVHLDKIKLADGGKTQLVERGAVLVADLPDGIPDDLDYDYYIAEAEKVVLSVTDPEVKITTTIPRSELSKTQHERMQLNQETKAPDPERCAEIDLTRSHADWAQRFKGSRYDSMKSLLVRLWLNGNGTLTAGDLLWCGEQLDAADGYFGGNNQRTLRRMVEWISRDISPFRLPQTIEETADRAITWAQEHVEPLKRKKKEMHHKDALTSDYINGEALRRYAKHKDDFKLACSVSAVAVKHGRELNVAFVADIIRDVQGYFSEKDIAA